MKGDEACPQADPWQPVGHQPSVEEEEEGVDVS